ALVVGALCLYGIGSALALVQSVPHSDVDVWHPYIDESDIDAMEWAKANTDGDAQFMVVGQQAEWFPAFSERTSVVGEWGAEWERGEFKRQQQMFSDMLDCQSRLQDCLIDVRSDNNLHADYAYIPETYDTISLRHSIEETLSWQTVYEHDGVA